MTRKEKKTLAFFPLFSWPLSSFNSKTLDFFVYMSRIVYLQALCQCYRRACTCYDRSDAIKSKLVVVAAA